jgi:hypothetical protein
MIMPSPCAAILSQYIGYQLRTSLIIRVSIIYVMMVHRLRGMNSIGIALSCQYWAWFGLALRALRQRKHKMPEGL